MQWPRVHKDDQHKDGGKAACCCCQVAVVGVRGCLGLWLVEGMSAGRGTH